MEDEIKMTLGEDGNPIWERLVWERWSPFRDGIQAFSHGRHPIESGVFIHQPKGVAMWVRRMPDVAEYGAFCAGHMPGVIFADWLEENHQDAPADCLRLLREMKT